MSDNYLITGYWGEPHVTAENDRGIHAAIFGAGRFVLPVGKQFKAEYIGNNTIRMYDGKLLDNGAAAGIPAGEYIDLLIANAGQGKKRNDLIVFQYEKDGSTLIESGKFVVIQGEETSGTASDPVLTQQDLLSNEATFDQFALWRVPVSGTTISAPENLIRFPAFSIASLAEDVGELGRDQSDIYQRVNCLSYDYIVDYGTIQMPKEGVTWEFRKWLSGMAECWGTVSFVYSSEMVANGNYASATVINGVRFPEGLFISAPTVSFVPFGAGYPTVTGSSPSEYGVSALIKTEWAIKDDTIWIHTIAKGRWK